MKNNCVIFCIGGLSVLSIGSIFLGIIWVLVISESREKVDTYQISNFNYITNSTSVEYAVISKKLSEKEFISFRSAECTYSTISKLSTITSSRYEFTGICHCRKDGNSRRYVQVLPRTLYFVVSIVSLPLAMKVAKDYFTEVCILLSRKREGIDDNLNLDVFEEDSNVDFGEYCPEEDIVADLLQRVGEQLSEKEIDGDISNVENECSGHCMSAIYLTDDVALKAMDEENCESKFHSGKVISTQVHEPSGEVEIFDTSVMEFLQDQLGPYCRGQSLFTYMAEGKEVTIQLCEAFNPIPAEGEIFDNIECKPSKVLEN